MVQQLLSDVNEKARQIVDLQNQSEWFKRHMFGRRSEKLDANQLPLFEGITRSTSCHVGRAALVARPIFTRGR